MKCDVCGIQSSGFVAPDEDGRYWCLDCIEKWEKEHKESWADGAPLNPINPYTGELSAMAVAFNCMNGHPFPKNMGEVK